LPQWRGILLPEHPMNDAVAIAPPPPPPVTREARVVFSGERREFRRLILRGALLELCTAGFYRFWLATDIRRHLWSHTSVEGDAAEYTGTAKELLIGFLIALAILVPIYVGYALLGIEAERLQAFASIPLVAFLYAFGQFAIFRARRYRATRTVWRGVRFWMTGSGWNYSWRACLWTLLTVITIGLTLPWREAALERFKMRHTFYGDLPGAFTATGGQLFRQAWWLWALLLAPVVIDLTLIGAQLTAVEILAAGAGPISGSWAWGILSLSSFIMLPFVYPAYKAISWRWWISGIRIGNVRFESILRNGQFIGLYWAVIGWVLLILVVYMAIFATALALLMNAQGTADVGDVLRRIPTFMLYAVPLAFYLVLALATGFILRLYLNRGVWERVANSTTVYNLEAADNVQARGDMASALGEGFADSLDICGL
jgi:uncharacterized membrane protein YjgN (DUF898 family)